MTIQGATHHRKFSALARPFYSVEVLGDGRDAVRVPDSKYEVGNISGHKAKVVDAAIFVENEFGRGELVHGKYLWHS